MNRFFVLACAVSTGCIGTADDLEPLEPGGEPSTAAVAPSQVVRPGTSLSSVKTLTRIAFAGVEARAVPGGLRATLPWGTKLDALAPVIEWAGARLDPAPGTTLSFAQPVTYVVTAEDGSRAEYSVTVDTEVDAIDLTKVAVFNSPTDVASWPVTTKLQRITMIPAGQTDDGLRFQFPALSTWPDYTPPGWEGPLQYTVWAVVKVNGQWATSGFIQMWKGRVSTGAPILTDFARNWAYDGRWGTLAGYHPVAGEEMGFFVTAGNARGDGTVTSLRARSNVVRVALPAGDTGVFDF